LKKSTYIIICLFLICIGNEVYAQQISFDKARGFYSSPFQLTLATDLPGATLKYTIDGSEPNDLNGMAYNSAINVNGTVVIRAAAYNTTDTIFENSTYLFLADILTQVDSLPGYPGGCEMDPDVVNDPLYSAMMEDVMKRIPTLSVSLSQYDFNNDTAGIYANPEERGSDWERKASLELIDVDGTTMFAETAGFRIHGGASRRRAKKTFRVLFKEKYGEKKLEYPLFGEQANDEIDGLVLRSRGGTSWVTGREDHHDWAQYYRDQCASDLYREMDNVSSHGQKAHLYINGIYWGLYNIIEYLHNDFHAAYFGGDKDEYDVINQSGIEYGDSLNWYHVQNLAEIGFTNQAELDSIEKYVDVTNLFDYTILNQFGGNVDWDHNNWYASRRKTQEGKWRFFPWDNEQFFKLLDRNILDNYNALKPSQIFTALIAHPDMLQKYNDQVQCLCYDEGILTPQKIDSLWMAGYDKFDIAVIGESARWGDLHRPDTAYTFYNEYLTEQARLRNDYFPARRDTFINQLIEKGWKNNLSAAVFNNNGGQVANGFQATITNPNATGNIYFTTDGTDPRLAGGALNPAAQLYSGAVPISAVTKISARIFDGNEWSPMCPKIYFPIQNYSDIVINEIHYHPQDSIIVAINDTIDGDEYEFIEIHNKGNQPVNMSQVALKVGVLYDFAFGTIIQPNEYFVIAEDSLDFNDKYGFYPDAAFVGKASNGGEAIKLFDPFNNVIDEVHYDDNAPWDDVPDGSGYSLALKPNQTNNNIASAWSTQASRVTPKAENDFCFPISDNSFNIDVSCFGSTNGSVVFLPSGGTAPYSYSWSNGMNSQNLMAVAAGTYTITLTDFYNCNYTKSFVINEPTDITTSLTTTDLLCSGVLTGAAQLTVSGGTPNYSYSWSNGNTNQNLTNAAAGTYIVDITDSNNCIKTDTAIINEPSAMQLSHLHIDESIAGENDGVINLAVAGGIAPYTYAWSHGPNYQDVNNLAPGNYSVVVTDANNCAETYSVTILPGTPPCSIPTNIVASNLQNTSATLSWNVDPNVNSFIVEYRVQGMPNWNSFPSNYSFAILNNLVACTTYEARIKANCPSAQVSGYSNIYSFQTNGCVTPCATVTGLFSQNITTSCLNGQISSASPIANFTTVGAACKNNLNDNFSNGENNLDSELQVFPNPAENYINIELNQPIENSHAVINILNTKGQLVQSNQYLIDNGNRTIIPISQLPSGSYIIFMNTGKSNFSSQFIKL